MSNENGTVVQSGVLRTNFEEVGVTGFTTYCHWRRSEENHEAPPRCLW